MLSEYGQCTPAFTAVKIQLSWSLNAIIERNVISKRNTLMSTSVGRRRYICLKIIQLCVLVTPFTSCFIGVENKAPVKINSPSCLTFALTQNPLTLLLPVCLESLTKHTSAPSNGRCARTDAAAGLLSVRVAFSIPGTYSRTLSVSGSLPWPPFRPKGINYIVHTISTWEVLCSSIRRILRRIIAASSVCYHIIHYSWT